MIATAMTGAPPLVRGAGWAIVLLWALTAGVASYWIAVLGGQGVATDASYLDFARAFPPADTLMALCAVLCAEHLRRRRSTAVLWGLVTAGALGFVGVVDVTYNLQHGIYATWTPALAWEIYVNAFSLVFPCWLAWFCWTRREALGA
jgi:hypothetical protein